MPVLDGVFAHRGSRACTGLFSTLLLSALSAPTRYSLPPDLPPQSARWPNPPPRERTRPGGPRRPFATRAMRRMGGMRGSTPDTSGCGGQLRTLDRYWERKRWHDVRDAGVNSGHLTDTGKGRDGTTCTYVASLFTEGVDRPDARRLGRAGAVVWIRGMGNGKDVLSLFPLRPPVRLSELSSDCPNAV